MGRAGKARGEAGEAGGRLKVIGEAGSEAGDEAGGWRLEVRLEVKVVRAGGGVKMRLVI